MSAPVGGRWDDGVVVAELGCRQCEARAGALRGAGKAGCVGRALGQAGAPCQHDALVGKVDAYNVRHLANRSRSLAVSRIGAPLDAVSLPSAE